MERYKIQNRLNFVTLVYFCITALLLFSSLDQVFLGYAEGAAWIYIAYKGIPLCFQTYRPFYAFIAAAMLLLPLFNGLVVLSLSSRTRLVPDVGLSAA